MAFRKTKTEFNKEEKQELTKSYNNGMNSVSKDNLPRIQEVAGMLNREEKEIKNWIGNERARRKRSHPEPEAHTAKKPPQKLRAPNSYNLFVKDFFKSDEGKHIPGLVDKNKAASSKWKAMSHEEKERYHQLASQLPTPSDTPGAYNSWHETQRVLSNLQGNCDWAEKFGLHVVYVVCNKKNHYVGGTRCGREFLQSNPHLPASFLISTKPGVTPSVPQPSDRKELRARVQQQLNTKYSLAVGDSQARVPYKLLRPENVVGLPPGVTLSHPSTLAQHKLEAIYDCLPSIKFVGVPPKPPPSECEHSYAKDLAITSLKVTSSPSSSLGHTTLSTKGIECDVILDTQASTKKITRIGHSVKLLSSSYAPIGTAVTMTGDSVHGHNIPDGYVRVSITTIDVGVKPLLRGDNEDLTKGCITAWPLKCMRNV